MATTYPAFGAILGFLHGLVLMGLAFYSAGFGHGTYVPLVVSSAPLGLFGTVPAILGAPVVWASLGWVVFKARSPEWRRTAFLSVGLHLASAVMLVIWGGYGDLCSAFSSHDLRWLVAAWLLVYVAGHAMLGYKLLNPYPVPRTG